MREIWRSDKRRGAAAALALLAFASMPIVGRADGPSAIGFARDASQDLLMAVASKNPFASVERPWPGDERLRGRVIEVLPAGGYTYFALEAGDGPRWVVTATDGVAPGAHVEVKNMGTRRAFRSKRLGRSFEALVFGSVRVVSPEQVGG